MFQTSVPRAKDMVLSTTALCGELSPLAARRLIPSQSYRYHVLEDLTKAKLLRTYRRDHVKGYRLTRRAKDLLVGQYSTDAEVYNKMQLSKWAPEYRESHSVGKRKLLTIDEVLRLPVDQELIILRGQKVLLAEKFD